MAHCRLLFTLALLTCLTGCALDREAAVRAQLGTWLKLAQTEYFRSKVSCTVAVSRLAQLDIIGGPQPVPSVAAALPMIRQGGAVRFDMPGISPHAISQQIMTLDLSPGLGMLSSGVGPAKSCMDAPVQQAFLRVLLSGQTITAYDPGGNALVLIYPPEALVYFLRGNV